jgi:hypothetical protein
MNENVVYRHASNALDLLIGGAVRKLESETSSGEERVMKVRGLFKRLREECDALEEEYR